jgi:hypothetical protein
MVIPAYTSQMVTTCSSYTSFDTTLSVYDSCFGSCLAYDDDSGDDISGIASVSLCVCVCIYE